MNMPADLSNAVFIQDQQIKTDSLKVAEAFDKNHRDVLRKIESLECPLDFNERNFALVKYTDAKGEERPMYEMTKDGFMFLVMGFTGAKASQVKVAFIEAFNQMADILSKQQGMLQVIQAGSVVQLRSGSPDLTVNRVINEVAEIMWFKNGRLYKETLPVSCLSLGESSYLSPALMSALEIFWSTLFGHGIHNFNHSNRTDQIALNLTHILEVFPQLPVRAELTRILPNSKQPYPLFLEQNISVQSRLQRKTCRCWIFKNNQPGMIDVSSRGALHE